MLQRISAIALWVANYTARGKKIAREAEDLFLDIVE
jgi:hypothetical protein